MSAHQISDVALSLEYVKQYPRSHNDLNYKQVYLLEQCVIWQRLSIHLGWQCDNISASYAEISKTVQNEVYAGAKAFVSQNKGTINVEAGKTATLNVSDTPKVTDTLLELFKIDMETQKNAPQGQQKK